MVLNPMTMAKVPYDPAKDFVPIAILAVSTTSIVVHASVPAKTLKELIAYAKANPGKLSYGSAGAGTMSNLSGELFKQLTGLNDLVHIPYKGAGPGITDLVSGHIPMMTPNVTGQLLELHRAGKIRILAVNGAQRLAAAPDIPTAIEEGVPGMIGLLFLGLFAPAATPQGDRRPHHGGHPCGDGGRGISEAADFIGPRGGPRLQFPEGQAIHGRGDRALGPGGESRGLQGGVISRSCARRCSAARSTLLVEASGSSSTNQTKRGCA